MDVQVALHGEVDLPWTYRNADSSGRTAGSRIDLVLGNRAAMLLVRSLEVVSAVRDGGHSPVVVSLAAPVVRLTWRRPRPKLPELLQLPSAELKTSRSWEELVEQWQNSAALHALLHDAAGMDLEAL